MEIVSQRNYVNVIPANIVGKTLENDHALVENNVDIDILTDLYEQGIQLAKDRGLFFNSASFSEGTEDRDLDKMQMRAMARKLNYANDLVKNSRTKRSAIKARYEDGRSHIEGTKELIENIHSGYQKQYGEVIKKATEYMQAMNTAIGSISKYVSSGKDGKIYFKPEDYLIEFDNVISKYSGKKYSSNASSYFGNYTAEYKESNALYSMKYAKDKFEFWDKKLSAQGFEVKVMGDKICIFPDFKPLKEIYSSVARSNAKWGGSDIMAQEFQSLQTAIDSQKNTINNSVSRLLETFRQDNSHFETLVQLLIQLIKDLNQNNNSLVNM
ncbi:hypothetical protein [Providencia sp. Me31A]|uniref:hypothetical protein n=1 Tax=Providencia sp. Me31A TaxID=3392637 RepID=UPI003D2BE2A0